MGRTPAEARLGEDGATWGSRLIGLLGDGLGVAAASAACISVFAACRAPYPNALPNFTRSIQLVYVYSPGLLSRNELRTLDIQAPVREISKRMKAMFWVAGAVCGAVAGLMIWNRQRDEPVEDLAHRLESAWADHHTVV
jgi:hypothetical protein